MNIRRALIREYESTLMLFTRAGDVLAIAGGAVPAYYWKFGAFSIPAHYQSAILVAVILYMLVVPIFGKHGAFAKQNFYLKAKQGSVSWLAVLLLLMVAAFLTKTSVMYSREWILVWGIVTWGLLIGIRVLAICIIGGIKNKIGRRKKIVIVGANTLGAEVVRRIESSKWAGLEVVAFLDDATGLLGRPFQGVVVRGATTDVAVFVAAEGIDEVWLTLPLSKEDVIRRICHDLRHCTVDIRLVPNIFDFRLINHSMTEFDGLAILNLTESPMYGINKILKEIEDKVLATVILLVGSPIMLLVTAGIKLTSPGPIFYRQERVSWNGVPFVMLKFRSMPVGAEKGTGPVWAKKGEKRATPFGAFLRATSLDELPQFINVLKGDMSIVGPRPERTVLVEKFKDEIPDYMQKHLVKAGITGWAQINGWRGDTDLNKRIEYDLYYIENWSLWFDLKIILLTLFKGLVHKNAY